MGSVLDKLDTLFNVADRLIQATKVIGGSTIGAAMEQQQIIDTINARAGSESLGSAIYNRITKQTLALGQDVDASLAGTMSFMSNTIDPNKLEQLNGLAMRLSKLNPTEGLEGAAFSMKELMSGDYTSIAESFNMSGAMLEGSGVQQAGLKGDIDGFIKGMDELLNQQNMTQEAFQKMLDSPAAKWQRVVSNFNFNMAKAGENSVMALTPLFDLMNQMFEDGRIQAFFNGLSVAILIVSKLVSNLASIALGLETGILQNWGMVVPLLWMIIGALIIYNSKSLISMANTAKDIVLKIAHAAASSAETLAIIGLIIAQEGLNAAIALCPITWIIGAIIILIAVFYLAVAAVNHFAGTSISATGLIAGLFGVLFGFIYNRFAKFANIVLSIVEFFANVWKDPIYAVKKLFYDLSINALEDMVNIAKGIENLINRIPGMHIDITSGMEGILDKLKSERDDLESEADVVNLMRFEQKDYGEAFKSGYKWGDDLSKKFDLTNMFGLNNDIGAIAAGGEEEGIPNIDRVGEVGKINNTVDISSEDLKIMRELAEMKNIQNFVTLTPTVSVTTGDIRNGSDADTIVSQIKTMLERDIASSTSAVYG
ncbi:MAG TPA: hypothetical protein GX523_13310 [Desulfitobacterium dehalogenans]|uniref:Phage tail tape measure protein n=1 Tax=Desulfitobacterium dehalogenans TaxID=36854 RepID=A0A7C7D6T6_9FIRM|nr:hypothetical protein [Desulfitobacterium dehalogenans]